MTKLLDILEDYLIVEFGSETFERVDGSVSVAVRQAAIARFDQDKSWFFFLLSTSACGLGINLATADIVIIYDSNFNPHADIQAMNHAHRIGQSKRRVVYKLVVCASVEERVLQLAKKKLMLDQLFVNKSESQKEVEDILRWGTEELFSGFFYKGIDEKDASNDETVPRPEKRSKRRTGGLGDVYQDKCTEGSSKIIWNENVFLKLLDRSKFQVGSPDNFETDLENDMLGSVKTMEWTDETMEEEGKTNSLGVITDDAFALNSDKKEVVGGKEIEWGKLYPDSWYCSSERLRARQKERIAQRKAYEETSLVLGSCNPKFLSKFPPLSLRNRDKTDTSARPSEEAAAMTSGIPCNKPSELRPPICKGISAPKDERLPTTRNVRGPRGVERSSTSDGAALALYAPNAPDNSQRKSTNRNSSRSLGRINKQSNFPLNTSGCSGSGSKDLKSCYSDAPLPFPMDRSPLLKRKFPDSLESSSASSADFLQKIGSSKFPFEDMLPKNPPTILQNPGPDFLANLSQ